MKNNDESEASLVRAAAHGDQAAFSEIVRLYERLVYNTVKSKVLQSEDALDLSQEVFIKIWRSLPTWRGDCRLSTWIYKVALNTSFDFLRKTTIDTDPLDHRSDEDDRPLEVADTSLDASPEERLEQSETTRAVRRAIAKLPDDQREVVMLRDIDGYSYEEIADMLSLGIGTVKSRLNRARKRLKEIIKEEGGFFR